jgi:hypothetical protein
MLSAPSKQARRLNPKVSNLFRTTVHQARRILFLFLGLGFLVGLFLGSGHGFLLGFLCFKVLEHGPEVTFRKVADGYTIALRRGSGQEGKATSVTK